MNKKKITIIVASLNSQKTIEKTILSIKYQKYEPIEVIVIDGGSTDDTIEIIKKQELPDLKIISEPDKGIGDAWNKGLRLSSGDIIGILNSDDYYEENIFQGIGDLFLNVDEPLIGFGNVILINEKYNTRKLVEGRLRSKWGLLNGFGFLHPSVFFNKQALDKIGFFNPRIQIAVDTDWLLRAVSMGISFRKIPSLSYMRGGGISEVFQCKATGEYADALLVNGYNDLHISIFYLLRSMGRVKNFIKRILKSK